MNSKKDTSVSHRALDEIVKIKTALVTDIGKFKLEVVNQLKDFAEKHNSLAAQVASLEGVLKNLMNFVASELGKGQGSFEARFISIARSIRGVDVNVLAIAEMQKEIIGQLTQIDAVFQKLRSSGNDLPIDLTEAEIEQVKTDAGAWYQDLLQSAFVAAQESMKRQEKAADEAYEAEQKRAKEAAEKLAAEQTQAQSIEDELKKAAANERAVTTSTSGGPGSDFPEGAEIFGG